MLSTKKKRRMVVNGLPVHTLNVADSHPCMFLLSRMNWDTYSPNIFALGTCTWALSPQWRPSPWLFDVLISMTRRRKDVSCVCLVCSPFLFFSPCGLIRRVVLRMWWWEGDGEERWQAASWKKTWFFDFWERQSSSQTTPSLCAGSTEKRSDPS